VCYRGGRSSPPPVVIRRQCGGIQCPTGLSDRERDATRAATAGDNSTRRCEPARHARSHRKLHWAARGHRANATLRNRKWRHDHVNLPMCSAFQRHHKLAPSATVFMTTRQSLLRHRDAASRSFALFQQVFDDLLAPALAAVLLTLRLIAVQLPRACRCFGTDRDQVGHATTPGVAQATVRPPGLRP